MSNKTVPKLRFSEFTDDLSIEKLGDITQWTSGGTPPKDNSKYWNGDIPWVSASSMYGSDFSKSERTLTEEGLKNGSRIAKKGSLLILVRGSMLFNTVPVGLAGRDVAFNQDVKAVRSSLLKERYLLYFFQASEHKLLSKVVGTGIGAGKLEMSVLQRLETIVPLKKEQQKIADFLTTIDKKIETIDKKVELLKQYKKGVMQKIFTRQIRFKDEGGKDYPEWADKKIGDVTQLFSTRNKILAGAPVYSVTNKNGFVLQTEHFKKVIAGDDLSSYKIIEKDDFAYNPARINVGSIARFKQNIGTISSLYICFRPNKELNATFLEYFLQLDRTKFYFNTFGEGGVRIYLWYPLFALIKINLPSLAEQQKITDFLSSIDAKIKAEETKLASAKKFKKALLQKMFV